MEINNKKEKNKINKKIKEENDNSSKEPKTEIIANKSYTDPSQNNIDNKKNNERQIHEGISPKKMGNLKENENKKEEEEEKNNNNNNNNNETKNIFQPKENDDLNLILKEIENSKDNKSLDDFYNKLNEKFVALSEENKNIIINNLYNKSLFKIIKNNENIKRYFLLEKDKESIKEENFLKLTEEENKYELLDKLMNEKIIINNFENMDNTLNTIKTIKNKIDNLSFLYEDLTFLRLIR